MRKILIFSLSYYPSHIGGAEVAIKEITDRIDDIEFHMVTNHYDSTLPRYEKIGNVHVHRVGFGKNGADISTTHHPVFYFAKIFFVPIAAIMAITLHRRHQFDALWAMMSYMTYSIVLMRLVGVRTPYLLTLQEGDTFERVFRRWYIAMFHPLLSVGFRKATVVQAISTFLAKWARHMGFDGPVEVIPNAVNTAHFSQEYSKDEIASAKADIGKQDGDVYIVTTSRLVHKNGIDDVIRALPLVPENVKFLIFGIGPDEKKLKQLAENEGVSSRMIFWGQIGHNDMPRYLKACDIFTRPSRSEGMGNSFVEAFAAEIPVVATQEGGIADFLFDEKRNPDKKATGWAVDKDSPQQIAEAVKDIIENPQKVTGVIENAKKLAFEKYDWDIIARNMREKVFDRVVERV